MTTAQIKTIVPEIEKWDDSYLAHNVRISERDASGQFMLHHDKKALSLFLQEIKTASVSFASVEERFQFMIDAGYYKADLLEGIGGIENLQELYDAYDHEVRNGEYSTFYSAFAFYLSYAYKVLAKDLEDVYEGTLPIKRFDDKYVFLESRADRLVAEAMDAGATQGFEYIKAYVRRKARRLFSPATPTLSNGALRNGGQMTSCIILKFDDTIDSIGTLDTYTLELSKRGCGLGYDGTDLRSLGEMIKQLDNRAHGVLPVAKRCESALQYADQDGKRKGNGAFYLDIFHDDLYALLDAKKENTDERVRLTDLSIGVILRDKFMELSALDKGYYTFAPHSVYRATGIKLSDIDMSEWYDRLVADPRVRKTFRSTEETREMLANVAAESGYPYVVMRETMNEVHVFKNAKIYSSNLCTEIFQRMCDKYGVQCTLASVNILESILEKELAEVTELTMWHLNGVIDRVDLEVVPVIANAMRDFRAVGLGVANLQGAFAYFQIPYESVEAIDFARAIFSTMRYHVLKASCDAVAKYGVFKEFEDTTYADGTHFNQYREESFAPTTAKVQGICADYSIHVPTQEEWTALAARIQVEGLANAYQQAIAPTGSIGYQLEATASIAPNTQLVEKRATGNYTAFYPMPYLSPTNYMMYKDAYRVDDFKYLDLVAAIQKHIDQGISTTLYVTDAYTTGDWWARVDYAWRIGLKSLYYTRPKISAKVDSPTDGDGEEVKTYEECEMCAG